jgi:hypothetical protein
MKYVLVTGGVVSGLGKGVTASSIGVLLKACGHRVTSIKIGKLSLLKNRTILIIEEHTYHLSSAEPRFLANKI